MFQSCSCDVHSALYTPSCHNACCVTFPLETLPPGDPIEGVVYLRIVLSPEEASRIYEVSVFGKRLSKKSNNVVVFPFAFHIVEQLFKPLWSRMLLYVHEPSWASFALCFKLLMMMLLLASVLSFGCLSSSDAYPLTCPAREALPVATLRLI